MSKKELRAFIYFAYDLELNAIKIGMTERSVRGRMTDELSLIGSVEIDPCQKHPRRLEAAIHFCLRAHTLWGERFYPDKKVVAFVNHALTRGVDAALRRFGDDAIEHIGLAEFFRKRSIWKSVTAAIRPGHPTRQYARSAWFHVAMLSYEGGRRRCGSLVDFLVLCPLQEPFNGRGHIVFYEQERLYAIEKEFKDGKSEIVSLHEQPPAGFFPHHEAAA